MYFEIIKNIINNWDPIELLEHAPEDEYNDEILEISSRFVKEVNELVCVIYNVVKLSFGETFDKSLDDCYLIAENIIKKYKCKNNI